MNWLDWLMILILLVSGLNGLRKGAIGLLLGLIGTIVAFVAGARYSVPAVAYLEREFGTVHKLADFIAKYLPLPGNLFSIPAVSTDGEFFKSLGLPNTYLPFFQNYAHDVAPASTNVQSLGQLLTTGLAWLLLLGVVFLIIFVLARVILGLVGSLIAKAVNWATGGVGNKLAGFLLGVLEASFIITVILGLGSPFTSFPVLSWAAKGLHGSMLAPHFLNLFAILSPWLTRGISS